MHRTAINQEISAALCYFAAIATKFDKPTRTFRLPGAFYKDTRRQISTLIVDLVPHIGYAIILTVPKPNLRLAAVHMHDGEARIGEGREAGYVRWFADRTA